MIELRINLYEHDEELETKIKEELEPICSSVVTVEEQGNAGLIIGIIGLVIAIPGLVVAIKQIADWFEEKKELSQENTNEKPLNWDFSLNGVLYTVDSIGIKEERDEVIMRIVFGQKQDE